MEGCGGVGAWLRVMVLRDPQPRSGPGPEPFSLLEAERGCPSRATAGFAPPGPFWWGNQSAAALFPDGGWRILS